MLNVSLTAKVFGWNKLSTEMNILLVLIATGRVHYSPQVGYHNNNNSHNNNLFSAQNNAIKIKLAILVESDAKSPFSIATTPRCWEGRYSIPGLLHFTIKYHFLKCLV